MNLLRFGPIFIALSGLFVGASIVSLAVFGLQLGIDFTGGSILEVQYTESRPSTEDIQQTLADLDLGSIYIQHTNEDGVILRMKDLTEETHQDVLARLGGSATELRFESIGSVIGNKLRERASIISGVALLAIIIYVTFAFRRVVRPIPFWGWSVAALLTLAHDIIITLGILSLLGEYQGVQIQIPIVVALLTMIGYSINDTVVVFDRIRENLTRNIGFDFTDTVNRSLRQSLQRSINTSLTTLAVVLALLFFGGETLQYFALTLAIGIIVGTYSSLFVAPVLMNMWVLKGFSRKDPVKGEKK